MIATTLQRPYFGGQQCLTHWRFQMRVWSDRLPNSCGRAHDSRETAPCQRLCPCHPCADSGNLAHGSASSCPPLQRIPARLNLVHWQATSRASQQTHPHRTSGYICCWPPTHATLLAAPRQSTREDTGGTRSGAGASRRRVLAAISDRRQGK